MNFEVDPQLLLSQVGDLVQQNENLARISEELRECYNTAHSAWTSDYQAFKSYFEQLDQNINDLKNLIAAITSLSAHLRNHAYEAMRNAGN